MGLALFLFPLIFVPSAFEITVLRLVCRIFLTHALTDFTPMFRLLTFLSLLLFITACRSTKTDTYKPDKPLPNPSPMPPPTIVDLAVELSPQEAAMVIERMPQVERAFRGAWVATVDNIDYPSHRGLSVEALRTELLTILDRAVFLHLNALVFQVRPCGDALYLSELEPWSEYLTGVQGQSPGFDPLAFIIEEGHKRGIEIHAWFNPYRASHPTMRSAFAPTHITQTHPDWVVTYGTYKWMDPGNPEVKNHTLRVIEDVVSRYDVDGVHLDDYFYPYPIKNDAGVEIDFPDDATWNRFGVRSGLSRGDWRRKNVDDFVEELYGRVKNIKKHVKVGISPFGIWKPGFPVQVQGFNQYEKLYADAKKWLNQGWIDYFTPQLYWKIGAPAQSYPVLLDWWRSENTQQRHVWAGNYSSKVVDSQNTWDTQEIVEQVRISQSRPDANGNIHFSMKSLMPQNSPLGDQLKQEVYRLPALVPAMPWLNQFVLEKPDVQAYLDSDGTISAILRGHNNQPVWQWVVRARYGEWWTSQILFGTITKATFNQPPPGFTQPDEIVITALNRVGVESAPKVIRIRKSGT